jgi:hypothetical protein
MPPHQKAAVFSLFSGVFVEKDPNQSPCEMLKVQVQGNIQYICID